MLLSGFIPLLSIATAAGAEPLRLDALLRRAATRTYAEEVAPRARQAFATMRERYNTSKTPFIEYLDAGRTLLDAALKIEEARRDSNIALLDLQDAVGAGPGELFPR